MQDMFPDVELVYSVRNELDTVIEEGVGNIVQGFHVKRAKVN